MPGISSSFSSARHPGLRQRERGDYTGNRVTLPAWLAPVKSEARYMTQVSARLQISGASRLKEKWNAELTEWRQRPVGPLSVLSEHIVDVELVDISFIHAEEVFEDVFRMLPQLWSELHLGLHT